MLVSNRNMAFAESNYSSFYHDTYQAGVKSGVIDSNTVPYSKFAEECNEDIAPGYSSYLKNGGNSTFQQFAAENNYDQDPKGADPRLSVNTNSMSASNQLMAVSNAKASTDYNMKAGDILICHGTGSEGYFLGHAAIASSSKYVLEMRGIGYHNEHTTKKDFFERNTRGDAYVLVYRETKHPNYANDAASYAYNDMYKNISIRYEITTNLYHKNPSYCSKYVYLAYYWGANKNMLMFYPMGDHIVTPFGLIGNFIGSYVPEEIHKITSY